VSAQSIFRALSVPVFIAAMTLMYWLSIAGAPSSAQRVPRVIILFICVMTVIVAVRELQQAKVDDRDESNHETVYQSLKNWFAEHGQKVVFALISVGYFPAFVLVGFNIANAVFLALALPLAGLGQRLSLGWRVVLALASALFSAGIFHMIATAMGFNVPAPFGI
jgi:hypothetical protein